MYLDYEEKSFLNPTCCSNIWLYTECAIVDRGVKVTTETYLVKKTCLLEMGNDCEKKREGFM